MLSPIVYHLLLVAVSAYAFLWGRSDERMAAGICIIATIARYVGNSRPTQNDRPMKVLDGDDRERVQKAVMLLRLARALNQSRNGLDRSVSARVKGGRVTLSLKAKRPGAELEVWALEKEASYFQNVFGRQLAVEGG